MKRRILREIRLFSVFQQCSVCAGYEAAGGSGAVYLFVAGRWIARINQWAPRFTIRNAHLSTAHDNAQRRCILCVQLFTQDARDRTGIRETFVPPIIAAR